MHADHDSEGMSDDEREQHAKIALGVDPDE